MCAAEARRRAFRRVTALALLSAGALAVAALAAEPKLTTTSEKVRGSLSRKKPTPVTEDHWRPRLRVYAYDLPPAPGQEIAARSCLICHSATLITQQHKDSTAWEKTLGTMIGWGATVDSSERPALRRYLVEKFGPRQ